MSPKLKTALRSVSSPAAAADRQVEPPPVGSVPVAPLYEMLADGQSIWRNMYDAAYAFCTSDDLGLGSRVKDPVTGEIRNMTDEEKRHFYAEVQSLSDRR